MKPFGAFLRCLFISPELLVIIAGAACIQWLPGPFEHIAHRIATNGDILRYLGLLAAALVAYDVTVAKSILLPEDDNRNVLQNWDRFPDLKMCVWGGLIYALLFAAIGVIASLLDWAKPTPFHAVSLCVAIVGGLVTAGTFLLAQFNLAILLRKHSPKN